MLKPKPRAKSKNNAPSCKLRSMDKQDLMELDAELETYRAALDMV